MIDEPMTNELTIREMTHEDPLTIAEAYSAQDWDKPQKLLEGYYREQAAGERTVLVAELDGTFVGYLTIIWESHYPPFRDAGMPEIVDFSVLMAHQRKGFGTALMDEAERRIGERSSTVGIGVGLSAGYGAAQIMYAKRGYIPDGRGVQYDGKQLKFGDKTTVDHSLVMCFTKDLKEKKNT